MEILKGIPVSPGVAIGEVLAVSHEGFRIPRRFVTRDAVEDEVDRLDRALEAVAAEIRRDQQSIAEQLGEPIGAIFAAHLQMVRDTKLTTEIKSLVRKNHYSPEYAVSRVLRRYAKVFEELSTPYAHDVYDLEKSLLRNLLGRRREELSHLTSPVIVLAHDLTPSETANLDRRFVMGFVTELGGAGGHTAIVAKSLEIPAVVGVGQFLNEVSGGETVIVDGDHGLVILNPDEEAIARYRHEEEEHRTLTVRLRELRDLPAVTTDGQPIQLHANIEFPHEVHACLERGAAGVGLYRTEFLYLEGDVEPTEEVHYQAYVEVVQAMGNHPVVIRTLDLGADKLGREPGEHERNPFLGLRSIRLSLRNLPVFRTQLRAALRASALGPLRLMFPMITTLDELRRAKQLVADVMADLDDKQVEFCREIPLGMMVEVPAAVTMIDRFAQEVDFLSLGTNDLTQYTLAVDRTNKDVADLYHDSDPAVLRLIVQTIQAAGKAGVPVSLCGQMSGSAQYTILLLGLGLRSLSVPPSAVPEIKKICRSVNLSYCESVAKRVMAMDNASEIDKYLQEELQNVAPELAIR